MAYGIQIVNNAGAIQIDGESPNYSLLASGSMWGGGTVNFPAAVGTPLVFVRFNYSNFFVRLSALSSTSASFQIWNSPAPDVDAVSGQAGTIDYMIFGVAESLAPSTGYGLHIRNAANKLIFDSNRQYPRIRQVVTVPPLAIFGDGARHPTSGIEHSMGTNPWMLANQTINSYGFNFIQETPQPTSDLMSLAIRADTVFGNRILIQAVRMGITIGSSGSAWSYAPIQVALIP